jgi:hypothetical protein
MNGPGPSKAAPPSGAPAPPAGGGPGGFGPGPGPGGPHDADAVYSFTIANGAVSALSVTDDGVTRTLTLPSNATFTVGTGTVTETLTLTGAAETIVYSLISGSANYAVTKETTVVTAPSTTDHGVSFTLTGGAVTAMSLSDTHGSTTVTHAVDIVPGMSFSVAGGVITETLIQGNAVETIKYVQPVAGGLYAVSSQTSTLIPQGAATTALSVNPYDRAAFTISAGAVTAAKSVSPAGVSTAITSADTTYKVLAAGFVEAVTTVNGHSSYEVFYAGASSNGVYTEVAHGSGTTVDLVGLQTQLAQIPSAVLALL